MNTLWLKIASGVIGILIIIVLATMFIPGGDKEPAQQQTPQDDRSEQSFYGQAEEDESNSLAKPEPVDTSNPEPNEPVQVTNEEITQPAEVEAVPAQPQTKREVTIYIKELSDIEKIEAERLVSTAMPGFDIGRLPMTGYSLMMQTCRQIINRWPDSFYAFKCKRMYADLPERYQQRYNLTPEDMDTSMFFQSRAGTVPYPATIEER